MRVAKCEGVDVNHDVQKVTVTRLAR